MHSKQAGVKYKIKSIRVVYNRVLEDAFLAIDRRMIREDVIKELIQIAGRPTEEPPAEKVAEEDDCEYTPNYESYVVIFGVEVVRNT